MRVLVWIISPPPTRSNVPSWRTRRSLACIANGSEPISSRNSVPAVGLLEPPLLLPIRAGEGPLLVAKELAFEE